MMNQYKLTIPWQGPCEYQWRFLLVSCHNQTDQSAKP